MTDLILENSQYVSIVDNFISAESYRTYNINVAKWLGGVEYAVVLMDLVEQYNFLFKSAKLVSSEKYGRGWMFYTESRAFERCAVPAKSFRSAIKKFEELGFIKIAKWGLPYKSYYHLNKAAIGKWLLSNKVSSYSQGPNLDSPTEEQALPQGLTYEPYMNPIDETDIKREQALSAEAALLCDFLEESIRRRGDPNFKRKSPKIWLEGMIKLLKERSREDIEKAIIWSETARWFKSNVVSPKSLREKFTQLKIGVQSEAEQKVINSNRSYALSIRDKYPDKMKDLTFNDKCVTNRATGKDASFNLPFEQFRPIFLGLFGGRE